MTIPTILDWNIVICYLPNIQTNITTINIYIKEQGNDG